MSNGVQRTSAAQTPPTVEAANTLKSTFQNILSKADEAMDYLAGASVAAAAVTLNPGLLAGVPIAMLLDAGIEKAQEALNETPEQPVENKGFIGNISRTLGLSDD